MKNNASLMLLTITVLFLIISSSISMKLASANFFPDPGPDLPRIYIRNDRSIEPETAPIERIGNLYRLTDNIALYTIEIQRDNIVLDGMGHTIRGNATRIKGYDKENNGIFMFWQKNVNITRIKFKDSDTGIRISSCSHVNIVNNSFFDSLNRGITGSGSHILIEDNTFLDIYSDDPTISLSGSKNTIKKNNLIGNIRGINIEGQSNLIADNRIESLLPIIMDKADNNIIARNSITGPASSSYLPDQNYKGNEGIALFSRCSNNLIYGNNISGFVNQAFRTVFSCSNNTFYGNYLADNEFAIALQSGAVNHTFYGNTFRVDSYKIHIDDEVEGVIWDNGTIGNYWEDYNGTDANGDGIGDVPYTIIGYKWDIDVEGFVNFVSGQDNYPLMEPYDIKQNKIAIPSTLPLAAIIGIVSVIGLGIIVFIKKR